MVKKQKQETSAREQKRNAVSPHLDACTDKRLYLNDFDLPDADVDAIVITI